MGAGGTGYEDRVTIPTPEGVELDLTLAGLGSRGIAALVDGIIKLAIVAALLGMGALGAGTASPAPEPSGDADGLLVAAVLVAVVFVVNFGYDVLFETLASGRTPGKRWTGLRVVTLGGSAVGFTASAVRNLLRLIDTLPFGYAAGIVSILASPRNQRLGDMAAGTLVVRERREEPRAQWRAGRAAEDPSLQSWDVSAVTWDELVTVRRFLERREELTPEARDRLGWELAARLRPKVAGGADDMHPETWLEKVVAAKSARA